MRFAICCQAKVFAGKCIFTHPTTAEQKLPLNCSCNSVITWHSERFVTQNRGSHIWKKKWLGWWLNLPSSIKLVNQTLTKASREKSKKASFHQEKNSWSLFALYIYYLTDAIAPTLTFWRAVIVVFKLTLTLTQG